MAKMLRPDRSSLLWTAEHDKILEASQRPPAGGLGGSTGSMPVPNVERPAPVVRSRIVEFLGGPTSGRKLRVERLAVLDTASHELRPGRDLWLGIR